MTETVPGMDANTTRIEGLEPETDYIVQVSATNGAGTSILSAVTLVPAYETVSTGMWYSYVIASRIFSCMQALTTAVHLVP